ncbi:MAG: 4Fe-4S dicluster domain-containing protein [Chloroflexota bacterium]|nr:4Fe-4S dicluster domain-containing protein [Chloroflexota bacterium]
MSLTRRSFIKRGAVALAGVAVAGGGWSYVRGLLAPGGTSIARASNGAQQDSHDLSGQRWAFVVDNTKCIGCGKCLEACKRENDVPLEPQFNRTWVERYVEDEHGETYVDSPDGGIHGFDSEPGNVKYRNIHVARSFFVPKLCNQCENPPCVQVCPVSATYKTEDGVILVNRSRCIGCGYCIQACPYGARFLDPRFRVADKCTWCYHRISRAQAPACVEVCPVGARLFGDPSDPESPVAKVLRQRGVGVLKPGLGTRPRVFYVGLETEVR